ncbi:MAG: hypothetical protein HGB22_10965 [Chlorobiaceae bacterium]|nr:hypothetical protein [Chlorobiaceae bacterium]
MGKRQIIYTAQQIGGSRELLDREINLVTREQRVWHGYVTAIDQDKLELRDARSGKHTFKIAEIDKIYHEVITDY